MFAELGPRVVIKDPYTKLTAKHWCDVARRLNIRDVKLLTTVRSPVAIVRSWSRSRFLTRQWKAHPCAFEHLLEPMSRVNIELHRLQGAEVIQIPFPSVKRGL